MPAVESDKPSADRILEHRPCNYTPDPLATPFHRWLHRSTENEPVRKACGDRCIAGTSHLPPFDLKPLAGCGLATTIVASIIMSTTWNRRDGQRPGKFIH